MLPAIFWIVYCSSILSGPLCPSVGSVAGAVRLVVVVGLWLVRGGGGVVDARDWCGRNARPSGVDVGPRGVWGRSVLGCAGGVHWVGPGDAWSLWRPLWAQLAFRCL